MKSEIRELITDFKAAARIGHPEAVAAALDGLRVLPQVTSNQALEDGFIEGALLPLGEALAQPRLETDQLRLMCADPLAGMRAVGAAALSRRYLEGEAAVQEELKRLSRDGRREVRAALVLALSKAGREQPEMLQALAENWLRSDSARTRATALRLLPAAAGEQPDQVIELLAALRSESDKETRAALVEYLNTVAEAGQAKRVLALLADWASQAESSSWVMARALGSAWAATNAEEALAILKTLAGREKGQKQVRKALEALARQGAEEAVQAAMETWPEFKKYRKKVQK